MSKHLVVPQDVRVLTKGGWGPRYLRYLLSSTVFSCTPPEHCIYRSLHLCSCTLTFKVHCTGQLNILSKVPLIPQASSKVQLLRNTCEELNTRLLPPSTFSRSKGRRRRREDFSTGPMGVQMMCIHGWHVHGQRSPVHLQRRKHRTYPLGFAHVTLPVAHLLLLLEGLLHGTTASQQRCLLLPHLPLPAASPTPSPSLLLGT